MSPRTRIVILAALLILAVAAVALWNWGKTGRSAEQGMRDPLCPAETFAQLCAFQDANAGAASGGERPRVVFIGDSYTEYWQRFDHDLFGPGMVNRGIGGQTSEQVLLRFRRDVVRLRPDVVHLLVGTNDIAGNTGPSSPESFVDNLETMIDIAEANGIKVIVGTLPPARDFYWKPGVRPEPWLGRLNRMIRALAAERGVTLADYNAALAAPDGGFRKELYEDGAHLDEAGYRVMRRVFEAALRKAEAGKVPRVPGRASGRSRSVSGA